MLMQASAHKRRAMSLIEVMIAVGILAIVTLTSVTTMIGASRLARDAQEDMMALELVNQQIELVRAGVPYSSLGRTDLAGTDPDNDATFTLDRDIVYDEQFPTNGPTFTVSYRWSGFGTVEASGNNYIEYPDALGWGTDFDYTGRHLLIRPDSVFKRSQIGLITSHDPSTRRITVDCALNGWTDANWSVNPPVGTNFEIDGGRTCQLTISWVPRGKPDDDDNRRTVTREVFVPWRADT